MHKAIFLPSDDAGALAEARSSRRRLLTAAVAAPCSSVPAAPRHRRAGIAMVQIPYSGTAAAVKDVLSGDVPVIFTQFGTIVARLHCELARIIAAPTAREQLVAPGMEPAGNTPAQFAEEIRVERERWLAVARALAPPR